ncbi:MAG: hypothetical protein ACXVWZ_09690 [Nocardioides sp.]
MSFVTVFTVGAMGFVLLAPVLMVAVLVLTNAQMRRPAALEALVDDAPEREPAVEPAFALSRAA